MLRRATYSSFVFALLLGCLGPEPEPAVITIEEDQIVCERCIGTEGFGSSIAADGNTLVVKEDAIIHIFDTSEETVASVGTIGYDNGVRVLDIYLKSDTLIFGLEETDGTASVYIFGKDGTSWEVRQRLRSNVVGDGFGSSIDMHSNTLVISAPLNSGGTGNGSVYVYEKNDNLWNITTTLVAEEPRINDAFGTILATYKNYIYSGSSSSALHVIEKNGAEWQIMNTLDLLGSKMERSNDRVFVSAVEGVALVFKALQLGETGEVVENELDVTFPEAIASDGEVFDLKNNRGVVALQGGDEALELVLDGDRWSFVQELQSNAGERCDFSGVAIADNQVYLGGFDVNSNGPNSIWRVYLR